MKNQCFSYDDQDGVFLNDAILIRTSKNFIGAISEEVLNDADGGTESASSIFMASFRPRDVGVCADNFCVSDAGDAIELVGLTFEGELCGLFNKKYEAALAESVSDLESSNYCSKGWEMIGDAECRAIFAEVKASNVMAPAVA